MIWYFKPNQSLISDHKNSDIKTITLSDVTFLLQLSAEYHIKIFTNLKMKMRKWNVSFYISFGEQHYNTIITWRKDIYCDMMAIQQQHPTVHFKFITSLYLCHNSIYYPTIGWHILDVIFVRKSVVKKFSMKPFKSIGGWKWVTGNDKLEIEHLIWVMGRHSLKYKCQRHPENILSTKVSHNSFKKQKWRLLQHFRTIKNDKGLYSWTRGI